MLDVALLGYGAIGSHVIKAWKDGLLPHVRIVAVACRNPASLELPTELGVPVIAANRLLDYRLDVVLEAAGHAAVASVGPKLLASGVHLVIMSAGALADEETRDSLLVAAAAGGARIYVPAGAIAGLDAARAMALDPTSVISVRTTKPAEVVGGAGRRFAGTAREAAAAFPRSTNVASALGLAGVGLDSTMVEVWGEARETNRHEVHITCSFGEVETTVTSHPTANPRTSVLACFSAVAALRNLSEPLCFI
jgi:aspartate dehydrogenase